MPQDVFYDEIVSGLPSLTGHATAITGCTSGTGAFESFYFLQISSNNRASTGFYCAKASILKGARLVLLLNRPSKRAEETESALKAMAVQGTTVRHVE